MPRKDKNVTRPADVERSRLVSGMCREGLSHLRKATERLEKISHGGYSFFDTLAITDAAQQVVKIAQRLHELHTKE